MSFFPRWPILLILISILLFAVRLTNILNIPIESDEGGYLHSSVLIHHDFFANWDVSMRRFFGPTGILYMWVTAFFLNFIPQPLLAARLVSAIAGLGTGLGVFFLGKRLFHPTVGLLGLLLFAFSPIHVMSDRIAVMDSLLGTMYIWALFFAVKLALEPQWRWTILTGIFLGLSVWAKPTGKLFFTVIPFVIMLAQWRNWKQRGADENARHPKWVVILLMASLLVGYLFVLALKLSPSSDYMDQRVRELSQSTETILTQPWTPLGENGWAVLQMFRVYYDLPFFLFLPFIAVLLLSPNQGRMRFLLLAGTWSTFLILLLGVTFGSKYIYFGTLPLLLLIAAAAFYFPRRLSVFHGVISSIMTAVIMLILIIPMGRQDAIVLFDPINDHRYSKDKGWASTASCYGCAEILERIRGEVGHDTPAIVIAEGISGHLWQTFSALLYDQKNIEVRRFERVLNFIPEGKDETRKRDYYRIILDENEKTWDGERVYLVLHNDLSTPFADDRVTLLYELKKPTTPEFSGDYWIRLFVVEYGSP